MSEPTPQPPPPTDPALMTFEQLAAWYAANDAKRRNEGTIIIVQSPSR